MIAQDDVIYFVLTDRFFDADPDNNIDVDKSDPAKYHGGDFAGIINKIPYLKKLGISALWISPVYLSVGRCGEADGYHGYWALDFNRVDPHLYSQDPHLAEGSRQYLRNLADRLHQNNIKLILDMVVNHTGYHNRTYAEYPAKEIKEHWFNNTNRPDEIKGALHGLPDLNHANPDVVDYFVNNIITWIEDADIDAVRMDTVKNVEDAFWYQFKSYVNGKYRNITTIGEVLHHDVDFVSRYQREHDFDTLFDFPLRQAISATFIHNHPMTALARPRLALNEPRGILDLDRRYTNANRLVTLLDNHDLEKRFMTEILDRWGHWDRRRATKILKLALSFLFTTRGIPQLYYGTEIAMEGRSDPDNRRDMPWNLFGPDDEPLDSCEYEKQIFDHTRKLIEIRRRNHAIPFGYLFTLYCDTYVYAYLREFQGNTVIVVLNNGFADMPCPLPVEIDANSNIPSRIKDNLRHRTLVDLLDPAEKVPVEAGRINLALPAKHARILAPL